jgi:hypothetical protein
LGFRLHEGTRASETRATDDTSDEDDAGETPRENGVTEKRERRRTGVREGGREGGSERAGRGRELSR